MMIAFGPVPSRRLGRSLGINNIPPKICSYSCVYCQLGKTLQMQAERSHFYDPERIFTAVRNKIKKARQKGEAIDYLTFVPDGEPTLDINLGKEIDLLRPLGIKIAIITNASLIWREDVRTDLAKADWVSFKIDSTSGNIWHRMNRPWHSLKLPAILAGMLEFAEDYFGTLVTETMVVKNMNDGADNFSKIAGFLNHLQPVKAYLTVPIRPPAEKWVELPDEDILIKAFQILKEKITAVEYIVGYEGNRFGFTGNVEKDLLSITAVHPMREDAVGDLLVRAGAQWSSVHQLVAQGQLKETEYNGKRFYTRNLRKIVE